MGASSPLGVHFVVSLLPLAKDTDGIICPAPTTWVGSVTLHRVSASGQADAEPWLGLPWISSVYTDRKPYRPSCGHCRPNVSGLM